MFLDVIFIPLRMSPYVWINEIIYLKAAPSSVCFLFRKESYSFKKPNVYFVEHTVYGSIQAFIFNHIFD